MHNQKIETATVPQVLINTRPFIYDFESFKTTDKNEAKTNVTKRLELNCSSTGFDQQQVFHIFPFNFSKLFCF
jgi:hypothetical protein